MALIDASIPSVHTCFLTRKKIRRTFSRNSKADVVCGCCGYSAIAVPCMAKKVWEFENSNVIVYHSGTHTCEAKPPLPDATLKAEEFFKNNSASKPSQFPYECLRSSLHDGKTIEEVYSEAKGLTNLKKNSEHQAESCQGDKSSGPLL